MTAHLGRLLLLLGGFLVLLGLALLFGGKLHLGRLPGDIIIQRENFVFYFPLMTGIVLSLALSLLFMFFRKIY